MDDRSLEQRCFSHLDEAERLLTLEQGIDSEYVEISSSEGELTVAIVDGQVRHERCYDKEAIVRIEFAESPQEPSACDSSKSTAGTTQRWIEWN